jgi:hypothetical protein
VGGLEGDDCGSRAVAVDTVDRRRVEPERSKRGLEVRDGGRAVARLESSLLGGRCHGRNFGELRLDGGPLGSRRWTAAHERADEDEGEHEGEEEASGE